MKFLEDNRKCMSTNVVIKVWTGLGTVESQNLINEAYEEFFRIAAKYTRFSSQSLLSELNRSQNKLFSLDEEFNYLLSILLELAAFSNGRFDPTIIDLLEMNGYSSSFDRKKIIEEIKYVRDFKKYLITRPSWREIEHNKSKRTIKLKLDQRLDLGGVGKGHAIDCAAEVLSKGSSNFLIDAGGDIYGKGFNLGDHKTNSMSEWVVDLQIGRDEFLGKIELLPEGESVSSSGSWARSIGKFHHLIDPATGNPENEGLQTFVRGKKAIYTDGLATVLFLCGMDYIDKISKNYNMESIYINKQGKIFSSDAFEYEQ